VLREKGNVEGMSPFSVDWGSVAPPAGSLAAPQSKMKTVLVHFVPENLVW